MYTIKVCVMENMEKGNTGRSICILSGSQVAIKALDIFQLKSKLVWDCHHLLMRLAEHNRIQLVWVLGHMGNRWDQNSWSVSQARLLTSTYRPWTYPWHILRGCHGSYQVLDRQHWQSIQGRRQATDFLNRPSAKRAGEFLSFSKNQLRIMTGLLPGQFLLKDIKTGAGRQSWVW